MSEREGYVPPQETPEKKVERFYEGNLIDSTDATIRVVNKLKSALGSASREEVSKVHAELELLMAESNAMRFKAMEVLKILKPEAKTEASDIVLSDSDELVEQQINSLSPEEFVRLINRWAYDKIGVAPVPTKDLQGEKYGEFIDANFKTIRHIKLAGGRTYTLYRNLNNGRIDYRETEPFTG